jgi:hypothetical protein
MTTVPEMPSYAELHCISNFSFLTGASHPEELVEQAKKLGYHALQSQMSALCLALSALTWPRKRQILNY